MNLAMVRRPPDFWKAYRKIAKKRTQIPDLITCTVDWASDDQSKTDLLACQYDKV